MSSWREAALSPLAEATGVRVVIDPDGLVDPDGIAGEVDEVRDWWTLRATYERSGRHRPDGDPALTILVHGDAARSPLPWDIEQAATAITVRLPGSSDIRPVLMELEGPELDRAVDALGRQADEGRAVLGAVTGVAVATPLPISDQLRLAARVVARPRPAPALASLARAHLDDPVVAALLSDPPDPSPLQAAWERFATGADTAWAGAFDVAQAEVGLLFSAGVLHPVAASAGSRTWAVVGMRDPSDAEKAKELLDARTFTSSPDDQAGWLELAEWWGNVRRLTAHGPIELRERAWATWREIDEAFGPWLMANYGRVLSSSASPPSGVHRIADFLARRLRTGQTEKVLLIVLDGLGWAQWTHLRELIGLRALESHSTFAMVPTYTTVSRQSIFAGDLPTTFPDHLWVTSREEAHWKQFWASEGLPVTGAVYRRVRGRFPQDQIDFGTERALGLVVNMVDDLMHSSEMFGDAQLLAGLDLWAQNGFLVDLLQRATAQDFEIWLTSDHGNLECQPARPARKGITTDSAGKRLVVYPNTSLRREYGPEGITWDDIPGMPATAEPMVIAPSRLAYTNLQVCVSHGGLSLDEVVVPLVRVAA